MLRAVLALAVVLLVLLVGCAPARAPAPLGPRVQLDTDARACPFLGGAWVEGSLQWEKGGLLNLKLADPDAVVPPEGAERQVTAPISWPPGFSGVELPGGDLAVVDASGGLVAVTGNTYRFEGALVWSVAAWADGDGSYWVFDGLSACGDPGSVVPA